MTRAAAIIAALLDGKPGLVFERRTGMVHGWGLWMRGLPDRLGVITDDAARAVVEVLLNRPARPRAQVAPALGPLQAARALFYQDWDPPLREERGLRWLAGTTSILMHLLFVLLMLYIAMVRLPPPAAETDGTRVQIEFIGEDSPQEEGGGAKEATASTASPVAQTTEQPSASQPADVGSALPQEEQPQPVGPAAQQQVLQVTETDKPTTDFALPSPTPRTQESIPPQITVPELAVPTREVRIVEVPPAQRAVRRELELPVMPQRQITVREREIASPLPAIRSVELPRPTVQARQIDAPVPSIRQAEIASPTIAPAAGGGVPTEARGSGSAPAAAATRAQDRQATSGSGAGAAAPRPGGAPSARRGDDWGASARNVPGAASSGARDGPGLFNADGSVRLPGEGGAGKAPQAGPPGSRQAQQADADRASKWLERPDYPYEPTMFDRFWVPNESLLAEWVRRSIEEVEIPIPGTSKKVKCVVSILQLGGACALSDPNLNEQPASARPPPDIPVKRTPIPVDS